MNVQQITEATDPRIAAFCGLRDRTLRGEEIFIAEGALLVERLLRSRFETDAILVTEEQLESLESLICERAASTPVYVTPGTTLRQIAGFPFHRGALALGRRQIDPTFEELVRSASLAERPVQRWIVVPEVTKPENLGHVFRSAGAFRMDGVLLGPRCCDPFSRRSLRVSMGGSLFQPYARSQSLEAFWNDLRWLQSNGDFELWATVLDPTATSLDTLTIAPGGLPKRLGVLIGNEFDGLDATSIDICDRKVLIPMSPNADSLNLGVATGIFCYAIRTM